MDFERGRETMENSAEQHDRGPKRETAQMHTALSVLRRASASMSTTAALSLFACASMMLSSNTATPQHRNIATSDITSWEESGKEGGRQPALRSTKWFASVHVDGIPPYGGIRPCFFDSVFGRSCLPPFLRPTKRCRYPLVSSPVSSSKERRVPNGSAIPEGVFSYKYGVRSNTVYTVVESWGRWDMLRYQKWFTN